MKNIQSTYSHTIKVADFVIDNPLTARVFHQNGIDFCCGGQISIGEACLKKGLDTDNILSQIEAMERSLAEFKVLDSTRPTEVIDYILKRYHDVLKEEIPTLVFLMDKVSRVHCDQHPYLITLKELLMELISDLEPHMQKEEVILFPLIKYLDSSSKNNPLPGGTHCTAVQNPIHQMEVEHKEVGNLLKKIHSITDGYTLPDDACNSFRALYAALEKMETDLHLHIHLENNVLHPMALKCQKFHAGTI